MSAPRSSRTPRPRCCGSATPVNVAAIEEATRLLLDAKRIDFYARGNAAVVALDGQLKFFRFGTPTASYSDPLPAEAVRFAAQDGRYRFRDFEQRQCAQSARGGGGSRVRAGAAVIAITAQQSPLAALATVTIGVDAPENSQGYSTMLSRILQLAVIDMPGGRRRAEPQPLVARTGADRARCAGLRRSPRGLRLRSRCCRSAASRRSSRPRARPARRRHRGACRSLRRRIVM